MNTALLEAYRRQVAALAWDAEPKVHRLVETPTPRHHVYRTSVQAVPGKGFAGDHDRKSFYKGEHVPGREVSAISFELLRIFGVDPLMIGDNLITEGVRLDDLQEGDVLEVGEVVLRRSYREHRPCSLFLGRTSPEAYTLCREDGQRGALFIVEKGGEIRAGDAIRIKASASAESLQPTE